MLSGGGGGLERDFKGEGGSNTDPESEEGSRGGEVAGVGGWVCDSTFSISLLSLATTYSPLLLFFLLFFTFSLLQTKLYLYNAHPNCFFLLPAGHNVSPLLLSTPESCSFSSPFLSSLFILMTFLLPNDHFFFSFPSAPTPSRPNPVSLLFFGTFKQKSSLSSSSHLVSFSLLLF